MVNVAEGNLNKILQSMNDHDVILILNKPKKGVGLHVTKKSFLVIVILATHNSSSPANRIYNYKAHVFSIESR